MPKKAFTEEQMADAFEKRLRSRRPLPGIGRFSRVFREVDCRRGRPDFVGLVFRQTTRSFAHQSRHGLGAATVLSLLKKRSPRSARLLVERSGLTRRVVVRSLRELVASGLVESLDNDRYVLSGGGALFDIESTAFELKLKSPRRAIFQAQQYALFAQRVWIVIPPKRVGSFVRYRAVMSRWGIGLATFDSYTHVFAVAYAARRGVPVSREHQAYAMLRLAGDAAA